jgi:hypothetical protein
MKRSLNAIVIVALAGAVGPLGAQARPQQQPQQDDRTQVPRSHMPPAGMCRIWLHNVPPAQQPAPTDCASAVRNRPRNGRVVFSEQLRENPRLPVKSLKGPDPSKSPSDTPVAPPKADPKRVIKPPRPTPEP